MENKELYLIILSAVTTVYLFIRRLIKNIVTLQISTGKLKLTYKNKKEVKNDKDKSN